jgi:hypothetical protein
MEKEKLDQPWTSHAGAEAKDDPNFTQGKDTVVFFSRKTKVCFGEGSMAA